MFDLSSEGYLFFEKMAINKNENRPPCFLCEDLVQTTNTFPDMTFSGQSEGLWPMRGVPVVIL